jgi:DNA polymerase-3 subunit delta'
VSLHPVHGHDDIRKLFASAIVHRGLPAALLLHGPPGVGKQRLALWLGQALLCENTDVSGPCDECRSCRLVRRLEHPDVHWYFPLTRPSGVSGERQGTALEDARARTLAEIREQPLRPVVEDEPQGLYLAAVQQLRRRAIQRPSMAPRQVFIVARAEELVPQESSPEAANALLKLLEEPPTDTWFVLTSSEPGRLLPTIRSRTLPLYVPALSTEEVREFLSHRMNVEGEAADRAALLSRGAIGKALGFLDEDGEPGPLERVRRDAFQLLEAGLSNRRGVAFERALRYPVTGARGLGSLLSALETWIRDLGAAAAGAPEAIVNQSERDRLEKAVRDRTLHPSQAARALERLDEARILAAGNVNPQLIVAGLLRALQGAFAPEPHSP